MSYLIRRPLSSEERNALSIASPITAHLLFHRGICTSKEAQEFLNPDYNISCHDPFLLKDAEKSAKRIIQAIQSGQKIAIYSDYDADGIPGAAIFDDFFHRIGYTNFLIYIPHRHDEGFGVNEGAVEELIESGVNLIVTVDCGITDVKAIHLATSKGIDVIVTDHHEPPSELPPAFAIVDPKQNDCLYPDKNLCGSGVAYKLIQAILKQERFGLKEGMEKWLLDLVGIATLSDMVPLIGENRVFAHYGLAVLRKSPRKGIMQLLRKLRISQSHVTEDDIAFMVTPRINAASRMGAPIDAFHLLTAKTDEQGRASANRLDEINNERKGVVSALVKEIKKAVKERHLDHMPSVIVLGNPNWRPSLLGLAANSCAEEFERPVFLWGRDGESVIKGSCRSEGSTHVVELMRAVEPGVIAQFGGHKHSGGFSVSNEQIHYLDIKLNEAMDKILLGSSARASSVNEKSIDMEMNIDDIGPSLHSDLAKLAPFGIGNPKPVFLFRNACPQSVRFFGKTNDHVEIVFKKINGANIKAISFFGAGTEWAKNMKSGMSIDLIASVEKSMFQNKPEIRLRIEQVIIK